MTQVSAGEGTGHTYKPELFMLTNKSNGTGADILSTTGCYVFSIIRVIIYLSVVVFLFKGHPQLWPQTCVYSHKLACRLI